MSWRATAPRPAPPVTSTSADSLFGPTTPNHKPSPRTASSSSGSAASLLARHMADMDDGASIRSGRSGRSGMTVSGRLWDGMGRQRKDSNASVATTVRERRSTYGSRSDSNDGEGDSAAGMEMELEDSPVASRAEPEPSRAEADGVAPQVVKRQRTRTNLQTGDSPSRASWMAGSASKSAAVTSAVQTDTSARLSPSSTRGSSKAPATLLEIPPLSLENDTASSSSSLTPTPTTKSSLSFQPAEPKSPASPPSPSPSSLAPPPPSSAPTPRAQPSSASNASSRRSWFSRAPIDEPEETLKTTLAPVADSEVDGDGDTPMTDPAPSTDVPTPADPSPTSNGLTVPPSSTVAQTQDRARQLALQQASASIVAQSAAGKGWFSILSRSTSTASLPREAAKAEAKGAAEEGTGESRVGAAVDESGEEAAGKEAKEGERGGTIKGSTSTTDYDESTLTPRPSRTPVPNVANQRLSWWGWGGSSAEGPSEPAAETRVVEGEEASEYTAAGEPEEPPLSDSASKSPSTSSIAAPAAVAPPPKSWLTTIWGEFPDEATARKKVVEAATRAQAQGSSVKAMVIEGAINSAPKDPTDVSSTSASTFNSAFDKSGTIAVPPPAAVQALKHQSSWSFFPSRRSSSGTTLLPNGTPPGPGSKLGVASSAASTRSRTSTTTEGNSSPSSPYLAPADAPLKPLTGSIRNSARPAPYEPDPPFENLVLPTFTDTFERPPRSFPLEKSKLTKAVSVVSAYLFHQPPPTSPPLAGASEKRHMVGPDPAARLPKSLDVVEEPARLSKVKRVVTIGVHGWFPTQKLKVVFGEPTGTSVKFATMMHDAVQSYLESKDISSFNIQAIALEGHGKIEDRVNKLYDQLIAREEWVQALKKADIVFLATHSQGSVASTQLLARMLDQGLIEGAHTHMLAMCAIAQGPFVYLYQSYTLSPYFNYVESEPARELFEFQDPESVPAIKFLESLRIILAAGIKVTVVGSINDQVVPLYSALFSGISHPGILRAVYIDSQAFRTSDFLANLVVFAARLRNAGLQDHDLTYHVSEALAGALTGVGHSKIYEEEEVFNLAVRYAFETTTLAESPTLLDHKARSPSLSMSFNPRDRRNPYLLTWALRGIIEDPQVRELFGEELTALREAFETWKPQTKTLKEVKLKLEGIKMLQRAKDGKL